MNDSVNIILREISLQVVSLLGSDHIQVPGRFEVTGSVR